MTRSSAGKQLSTLQELSPTLQRLKAAADREASTLEEQWGAAMQQVSNLASRMADFNSGSPDQMKEINDLQDQLQAKTAQLNERMAIDEAR